MKVQLNTDANIAGNEALSQQVEAIINDTLDRFSQHITRVEVHLSDENSNEKFGANDQRCLIEVRLANHQPIAVSDQGPDIGAVHPRCCRENEKFARHYSRKVARSLSD
jgi:ribosome-associated translation inhibitor RaiA